MKWLASRGINPVTAKKYKLGWNGGAEEKDTYRPRKAWGLKEIKKKDGKFKPLWLPVRLIILCFLNGKICQLRIWRRAESIKGDEILRCVRIEKNTIMFEYESKVFAAVEAKLDAMAMLQYSKIKAVPINNPKLKHNRDVDIDVIVKRSIDSVKRQGYNTLKGKARPNQARKGGCNGSI